jgi:hypothetical protein
MHLQIRVLPATSPPDLEKLLGVLYEAGVNLVAAGGGNLELGDEFAFAPAHEHAQQAVEALTGAGYREPRVLNAEKGDFKLCWLHPNTPGQLRGCIAEAAAENLEAGKVIKDILVGVEVDDEGRVPVQVYSVEVKSRANAG